MSPNLHGLLMIAVVALTTMLIRFAPFLLFPAGRKTPAFVLYLGRVLPYAVIAMLVVYCFRGLGTASSGQLLAELLSTALVVGTYVWKRNSILSIVGGTACYIILVNFVI